MSPSSTVPEALARHALTIPDDTAVLYPNKDATSYDRLSFKQIHTITDRLATDWFQKLVKIVKVENERPVVGLLATSRVEYFLHLIALIKAGVTVLCLSPRNTQVALTHLLRETNASALITDEHLAKQAADLHQESIPILTYTNSSRIFEDFIDVESSLPIPKFKVPTTDASHNIPVIMHSSGSTSLPKPIYLSNSYLFNNVSNLNERVQWDVTELTLTCTPLFHIYGFLYGAMASFLFGTAFALPLTQTYPPTTSMMLRSIELSHAKVIQVLPLQIELIVAYLEGDLSPLKSLKSVQYGGAACSDKVLKALTDAGVHPRSFYGATEFGGLMTTPPNSHAPAMRIIPNSKCHFDAHDDLFELVIDASHPGLAENIPTPFYTSDLFTSPSPGMYILQGRKNDIIAHPNGMKTRAFELEQVLKSYPSIKRALVLGDGRLFPCALIEGEDVWDAVEEMNRKAGETRVPKELVWVGDLTGMPVTVKGNLNRKKAEEMYKGIMDEMYDRFLNGTGAPGTTIETTTNSTDDIVQDLVEKISEHHVDPTRSLFDQGLDSITAIRLRNGLTTAIQVPLPSNVVYENPTVIALKTVVHRAKTVLESVARIVDHPVNVDESLFSHGLDSMTAVRLGNDISARLGIKISQNIVYENPSVAELVSVVVRGQGGQEYKNHVEETAELVEKYVRLLEMAKEEKKEEEEVKETGGGQVVVLTGATGSFGGHILKDLLENRNVSKVYCLVRGQDPQRRLLNSFAQRELDTSILDSRRVVAFSYDMTDDKLGLTDEIYERLCMETTMVIHNAWKMNFNLPVKQFEADCIRGSYNLILFSQKRRIKHFHFISSISACLNYKTKSGKIPERALPDDPSVTSAMGYGQGKYVVEKISEAAHRLLGIPVDVCRVGQISGSSVSGAWNTSEMYPNLIVAGTQYMGKLPDLTETVDWAPVDVLSKTMTSIALVHPATTFAVHHLVNPHQISWSEFLVTLQEAGLRFSTVSPTEWLADLKSEEQLRKNNPALKLVTFHESIMSSSGEKRPLFETSETEELSEALRDCEALNAKLIGRYIRWWKKVGFLEETETREVRKSAMIA